METKQEQSVKKNKALHYIFLFYAFLITITYSPLCVFLSSIVFQYGDKIKEDKRIAIGQMYNGWLGATLFSSAGILALLGLCGFWLSIFFKNTKRSKLIAVIKSCLYGGLISIILVVLHGIVVVFTKDPFQPGNFMTLIVFLPFVLGTLPLAYHALNYVLDEKE